MTSTLVERADRPGAAGPAEHDLVFVGAGASTAYVLLALLAGLRTEAPGPPRRIAVVERAPDPFSGVAYGSRAARTSLLITPLRDFLPEDERALFVPWLTQNKDWVFDEFLASAGPLAGRWWARHRAEIQRGAFDSLYLPRYVFGTYLMRRTRSAIASAAAAGVATVDLVQDAVRSIEPDGDSYALHGSDGVVRGRHVVLATGSAPVRPRLPDHAETPPAVLVDDPFDEMGTALERIRHGLERAAEAAHAARGPRRGERRHHGHAVPDQRPARGRPAEHDVHHPVAPRRAARTPRTDQVPRARSRPHGSWRSRTPPTCRPRRCTGRPWTTSAAAGPPA